MAVELEIGNRLAEWWWIGWMVEDQQWIRSRLVRLTWIDSDWLRLVQSGERRSAVDWCRMGIRWALDGHWMGIGLAEWTRIGWLVEGLVWTDWVVWDWQWIGWENDDWQSIGWRVSVNWTQANHDFPRLVGPYSTSSLRSLRNVRRDWPWIGIDWRIIEMPGVNRYDSGPF